MKQDPNFISGQIKPEGNLQFLCVEDNISQSLPQGDDLCYSKFVIWILVTKFLETLHNFRKESLSSLHSDIDISTNHRLHK